jgi:uncharacterized protein
MSCEYRTEDCAFEVSGHTLVATKVLAASQSEPTIISFHGAGTGSTREGIRYLLDDLARCGLSSLCFDFSGHGGSTGVMADATLRIRMREAVAACGLLKAGPPLMVIGTSMGGAVATMLLPTLRPRGLVLFCPAAYPADTLDACFDEHFFVRVRQPGAHLTSLSYPSLDAYGGHYLLVLAREDTVISPPVVERYRHGAPTASSRAVMWLEGADHKAHRWLETHAIDRARVTEQVVSLARRAGA